MRRTHGKKKIREERDMRRMRRQAQLRDGPLGVVQSNDESSEPSGNGRSGKFDEY